MSNLIRINAGGNLYGGNLNAATIKDKLKDDFGVNSYVARTQKFITNIDKPTDYLQGKIDAYKLAAESTEATFTAHFTKYKDAGIPESDAIVLAEEAAYRDFKNRKALVDLEYPDAAADVGIRNITQGALGLNDLYKNGVTRGGTVQRRKAGKRRGRKRS